MSPVRPKVHVVGRRLEPEHHRLRDLLTRAAQPFEWHEADSPSAQDLLTRHGLNGAALPMLVDGDDVQTGVTVERLRELSGAAIPPARSEYDMHSSTL